MRKKIYIALALGLLATLGVSVGASAGGTKRRPAPTTTTATTAVATTATTVATTDVATTSVSTTDPTATTVATTDATTTTIADTTTPPGAVLIMTPMRNMAYLHGYSNVILSARVDGVAGGACTIEWGDKTVSVAMLQPQSGGAYACATNHVYQAPGRMIIKVVTTEPAVPATTEITIV